MPTTTLKCVQETNEKGQLTSQLFLHNKTLHNEHGPSYQEWDSNGQLVTQNFRVNGALHNEEGPAIEAWNSNGQLTIQEFYLNGYKYTESEWKKELSKKSDCDGRFVTIVGVKYRLERAD